MKKERPLTFTQLRMLRGALEGDPYAGVHGQSAHGGAWGTYVSLVRRGFLTQGYEITDAGRAALEAHDVATQTKRASVLR